MLTEIIRCAIAITIHSKSELVKYIDNKLSPDTDHFC